MKKGKMSVKEMKLKKNLESLYARVYFIVKKKLESIDFQKCKSFRYLWFYLIRVTCQLGKVKVKYKFEHKVQILNSN